MIRLLPEYLLARLLRTAKSKVVSKALKQSYARENLTFTAEDIVKAAQSSVATISRKKEIIYSMLR
jgi:hypothetical protein